MEILIPAGVLLILVGLSRPAYMWLAFPLLAFYANSLFGKRSLADIYSSKIPYGFLFAFVLVAFVYIVNSLASHRPLLKRAPLFRACFFFLAVGLISLIDTIDVMRGVKFFAGWGCYIAFFYIVVNALESMKLYKHFIIGNALNAALCSALMVFRAAQAGFTPRSAEIWDLTWLSSNEIGFYFEPIICICICVLFFSRKRFAWHGWVLVLFLLLLPAIVFAGTRGTWVSLMAASVFMLLRFPLKQKLKAVIALGTVAFVFYQAMSVSQYASWRLSTFTEFESNSEDFKGVPKSSIPTREYLLRVGWKMMLHHPINGVGLGNYSNYYDQYTAYMENPALRYLLNKSHTPHNFFLRIGAETGLLGLGATILLLVSVYRRLAEAVRTPYGEPWDSVLLGCYLGFIANVIHCLFQERIFGFYFWAFLGMIYVTLYHAERIESNRRSGVYHAGKVAHTGAEMQTIGRLPLVSPRRIREN